jgi:apolipoprotein N-acyltransferase
MNKLKLIGLSILSGLLLSPGWYEWGSGMYLMVAFLPLLFVEKYIYSNRQRIHASSTFLYASLTFLIWNLCTTWWIYYASLAGLITAVVVSTFFMSIAFWLFHLTHRLFGHVVGYTGFIIFWISFEFLYMYGEVDWPWLALGHGFMYEPKMIQWYEYTGIFGGSLWILFSNVFILRIFTYKEIRYNKLRYISFIASTALFIAVPIIISHSIYNNYKETTQPKNIIIVQNNIDPYMKFSAFSGKEQTKLLIDLAKPYLNDSIDYVVCPETSINNNNYTDYSTEKIWINDLNKTYDIQWIRSLTEKYPRLKYVVGIMGYKYYPNEKEKTETARSFPVGKGYYDSFNSAIQIDSSGYVPIYYKSKLVIGVEKMPYTQYLGFLENTILELGGIFRQHGTQKEREVFYDQVDSTAIAPVICYESVFGEFVTKYIKKGAGLIFVITNDGWWENTPGHRQHNEFSRFRAIETRRSVARSANTGISCFINQRGDILQSLGWWKRGVLVGTINVNHKETFYVKRGDYLARICIFLSLALFGITLTIIIINVFQKKQESV